MEVKIYDKIEDKKSGKFADYIDKIKSNLTWEDAIFILVVLAALIINLTMLSQLHQLPSPIYGGDYYNHLGSMEHIYQGGSLFQSGQLIGEIQWTPWLFHLLVVIFAKLTTLTLIKATIYFSLIALILGCTIVYLFISKFFDSKLFGIVAVLWHISYFPIFKYSPFAFYVILPLFLFGSYAFLKNPNYKTAIFFGVSYGLAGLSTTYVFIQGTFFLATLLFYFVFLRNITMSSDWKLSIQKNELTRSIILAAIVFSIGFAISMLWWYNPIFVHHAKTANDMQIYGFPEVKGFGGMINLAITGFKNEFSLLPSYFTDNASTAFKRLLTFLGIASLILVRRKNTQRTFINIMVVSALIGLLIHFITLPILGTLMASTGLFQVSMFYLGLLLALSALEIIIHYSSKPKLIGEYLPLAIFAIISLILIFGYSQNMRNVQKDVWWGVGKSDISPEMVELRQWLLQNTDLNDVFLSDNEDSFALNAMSGRKVVTYRRTHSSPYADMNQRMLDAAIMLYSTNNDLRKQLIQEYSVDYLYWHPRWIQNEFQINSQGQIAGISDPLSMDYTPEREATLAAAGVPFRRQTGYLDPAWLPTYPMRDLLVAYPARADYMSPWSSELDKFLELEKEIVINGQLAGKVYKVLPEPKTILEEPILTEQEIIVDVSGNETDAKDAKISSETNATDAVLE